MKKTRVTAIKLFSILMMLLLSFAVVACGSSGHYIDAPTETIKEELGAYTIPTYNVVDKDGVIMAGYTVTLKSATDPDGNDVPISYGSISADKTGIYTLVYTANPKKVDDVTVKIDFADRTAPTIEIDEDDIPAFFMTGNTYDIPTFKINGGADNSKCYTKVLYTDKDGNNEEEVDIEQGKFFAEKKSGNYTILIHVEDAAENAREYKYTRIVDGPEKIKEDVILYFDDAFGARQVSPREPDCYSGEFVSKDVEGTPVHDSENGSFKVTLKDVKALNSEVYFILDNPAITNVTKYGYLEMWVYNDNDFDVFGGTTWWNDTKLVSKKWTRITWSVANWGNNCDKTEAKVHPTNIIGTQLRLMGFGEDKNPRGTFYFSNMVGRYGDVNDVAELGYESGANSMTMHTATFTGEFSTEKAYGAEEGSYKVSSNDTYAAGNEAQVRLTAPLFKDVQGYDYLVFNIYNDNDYWASTATIWAQDQKLAPKSWNRVKFPVSLFYGAIYDAANEKPGMQLRPWDISGFTIRLITTADAASATFYLSSISAEYSTQKADDVISMGSAEDVTKLEAYETDHYTGEYTADTKHGNDAGSYKVTMTSKPTHNGEIYIRLKDPIISNISGYGYLELYIYNDNDFDATAAAIWAQDQTIAKKEWTRVEYPVSMFLEKNVYDVANEKPGMQLRPADITGFTVRITGLGNNTEATFYLSSIKAITNEKANLTKLYSFDEDKPEEGVNGYLTNNDTEKITVSYDTTKKYGEEKGSTKIEYKYGDKNDISGKLVLGKPLQAASEFDRIGFYLYNDTGMDLWVGYEWGGDAKCINGAWTFVEWTLDGGQQVGKSVSFEGMLFRIVAGDWATNFSATSTIYLSSWSGYNVSK